LPVTVATYVALVAPVMELPFRYHWYEPAPAAAVSVSLEAVNEAVGSAVILITTLPVAVHPFNVAVTVYVPARVEVSAALAGPFDHAKVEPEVAVAPKDTGVPLHPDVSGVVVTVGLGLMTKVSGAEVAEPHVPFAVTVNIPAVVGVIACVVAVVLQTLPETADDVSVTLPLPHTVSGPPAVIVGVGVAA